MLALEVWFVLCGVDHAQSIRIKSWAMMQVFWIVLMNLRGVGLTEKRLFQEPAKDMELSAA